MLLTPEKLTKLASLNRHADIHEREIILGFVNGQPEYSNVSSLLIGGMTDQGKTVITAYLCCMAVVAGGSLLIIDPHLNEKKHGLSNKIEPLSEWFAREPVDFEDIEQVVERFSWASEEYRHRKGRNGMTGKQPLFLVIDEFNELLGEFSKDEARIVTQTIGNIARGGRKYGMFVILCAHNWNLSSTGGSNVRKNIPARICVNCESAEMAMVLNTSDKKLIEQMCKPSLAKGEAIIKRPGYGLQRLGYPRTEREDCEAVARMIRKIEGKKQQKVRETAETRWEADGNDFKSPFPLLETGAETAETASQASLTPSNLLCFPGVKIAETAPETATETPETGMADTVRRLWATGMSHRDIATMVKLSGRKYPRYQELCRELGIPLQQSPGLTSQEWEAIKRQHNYTCPGCGRSEPEITLTKDHIVAKASFGPDNALNIQPLCVTCNQQKHTRTECYRQLDLTQESRGYKKRCLRSQKSSSSKGLTNRAAFLHQQTLPKRGGR